METPTLETERLLLRPATEGDLSFVLTLFSRSETNRFSAYGDISSPEEARRLFDAFIRPGGDTHFRLIADLRGTGEPVGTIGLYAYSEQNRRAELGYDLLREHWGKGLTTEAVREVLRYAFEELKLTASRLRRTRRTRRRCASSRRRDSGGRGFSASGTTTRADTTTKPTGGYSQRTGAPTAGRLSARATR